LDSGYLVYLLYIIGPLIAGLCLYWIVVRAPGRRLASDFANLGTPKGKTIKHIIKVVGPPTSTNTRANGRQLLRWTARGHHVELLFDASQICQGENPVSPQTPSVTRNELTRLKIAEPSDASATITVEEARKIIAQRNTIVKTPTDFTRITTSPVQNASEKSQITFCDTCGSNLSPNAKFCDTCGNSVTQQTGIPDKEMQAFSLDTLQRIMPPLAPAVAVTERDQTASVSCKNCGRELQYSDNFCDKCGTLIQLRYA
jgi:hypothetical protein